MQRWKVGADTRFRVNIVGKVRDSIVPGSDDATTYECIGCLAAFDERRHLCPKRGGERFGAV